MWYFATNVETQIALCTFNIKHRKSWEMEKLEAQTTTLNKSTTSEENNMKCGWTVNVIVVKIRNHNNFCDQLLSFFLPKDCQDRDLERKWASSDDSVHVSLVLAQFRWDNIVFLANWNQTILQHYTSLHVTVIQLAIMPPPGWKTRLLWVLPSKTTIFSLTLGPRTVKIKHGIRGGHCSLAGLRRFPKKNYIPSVPLFIISGKRWRGKLI